MKQLRQEFADTMLEIGQVDPRLVVMVGDISHGILQPFANGCPGRYYNVGICEPTIISMAAGIAKSGLTPVVHTISPFIIERAYEQIKLDFGYQELAVNLIGVGSAFDYAQLGCSHHCYNDLSVMSHFNTAQIFHPASAIEFNELFKQAYQNRAINYFRLTEYPHGVEFSRDMLQIGRGIVVKEGDAITIACLGAQLKNALEVHTRLENEGIYAEILYFPTFKPFDCDLVYKSVAKTRKILTLEEASSADGLYHRVLAATVKLSNVEYATLAIDHFIHSYGSYNDLCEEIGLSPEGILKTIKKEFSNLNNIENILK